jgi:hypothetical protein
MPLKPNMRIELIAMCRCITAASGRFYLRTSRIKATDSSNMRPSALEDPYGSMEDVRRATLYELLIPHAENYTDNVGRILHKLTAIPQPCNID